MRKAADNQHLERVLSDLTQAECDAGGKVENEYLCLISSAQRATTLAHYDIYLDGEAAFGRNKYLDSGVRNTVAHHRDCDGKDAYLDCR